MSELCHIQGIAGNPRNCDQWGHKVSEAIKSSPLYKANHDKGKYDCFISYRVQTEKDIAEKLYYVLKLKNLNPFLDRFV